MVVGRWTNDQWLLVVPRTNNGWWSLYEPKHGCWSLYERKNEWLEVVTLYERTKNIYISLCSATRSPAVYALPCWRSLRRSHFPITSGSRHAGVAGIHFAHTRTVLIVTVRCQVQCAVLAVNCNACDERKTSNEAKRWGGGVAGWWEHPIPPFIPPSKYL